jgi:hypothetical protein
MGMMNMGIILLIICTGKPDMMSAPMVIITETIAIIMGDIIRTSFLKKMSISMKITIMAEGAETAICMNISTPNVSSATGSPVMWYASSPL